MTASDDSLSITYQVALSGYLAHPNEETLQQAHELGRGAMNAGLGILDLVRLHHRALAKGAWFVDRPAAMVPWVPIIETFLLAALSSFEAAYRDFRRTRERSQEPNEALGERNEAFALSKAQLEEEISVRKKTEADRRESKDHNFQLFQQAQAREENLRELSSRGLTAQEEERRRISRELHDEIGQALNAVNVAIALLKQQARSDSDFQRTVSEAERMLAQSMENVRCFARELRSAKEDAHDGPAISKRLEGFQQVDDIHGQPVRRSSGNLTTRELEVLQLVAEGHPNKQIADILNLSIKTVEKHRQRVMDKLNIHETAGLTRYALTHRIVKEKDPIGPNAGPVAVPEETSETQS